MFNHRCYQAHRDKNRKRRNDNKAVQQRGWGDYMLHPKDPIEYHSTPISQCEAWSTRLSWFGSVQTMVKVGLRGHEGVFQVNQYHACFPKEFMEEALKEAHGGVHILLGRTTQNEVPLVVLGYRCSRKTVLHFVLTKNGASSKPVMPYQMKYTDTFSNICTQHVDGPQVVSIFFAGYNIIDTQNQLHQDNMKLE